MNKEQQIEEIAVIGCVRNPQAHTAEECGKCDFKNGQCNSYRRAEALYNAGYRKIDANCVVITKAELKEYKRQAVKEFAEKLKGTILENEEIIRDWTGDRPRLRREVDVDVLIEEIDSLLEDCRND